MAADETVSMACPSCGTVIDTTNAEPLSRVPCPNCGEKVRVERAFNNFVVLETLGVGGMGTVYKARDTLLDRLVALKLLRKDLGGEIDYSTRLKQEARVAASVNHPNVIQVFSSGTDHGQFYLVMELVDHGSLDDLIEQRKRLPEAQVLEAGIQVAKGLRAAHVKGLIHRDVKPANILFADEHFSKIGDFGLAGVAAEQAENRGEIWGTPYYVAPERLNNDAEDFRSDIYSLGATLFHALAGRAPIEGDTNSAVALADLKKNPLKIDAVVGDVSPATARVLNRMLAPDPAKRFSSYDELVAELERAQRILTGKEDVDPAQRKRKTRIIMTMSALVLAVVAAVAFVLVRNREREMETSAKSQVAQAELGRPMAEARRQLLQGQYKPAREAFARIANGAKNVQPLYDWARSQEGLAALLNREAGPAQHAFQEVEKEGERGFAREDVDLARFLVGTSRAMNAAGVGDPGYKARSDNFESFALLLFGLKDIAQANANGATAFLEKFMAAEPVGRDAWIAEYKPVAQKYLDDCRLYAAYRSEAAKLGESPARLEKLRELKKKLKTHSAISDELSAEEKSLAPRVAEQQKVEATAHKKALDAEAPIWNAALASYKQKVAAYDFTGARDAVAGAKVSEPSLKQAQEAAQKKAQWLIDWKNKLMEDLNRTHFSGTIADTGGVQYTGIESATAQTIGLKLPFGSAQLPWIKLGSNAFLAIASSFIKPNAPDVADRQWLCAVFAAETGQTDAARQFAEAAAKTKPQYREEMSLLFPSQ
jgi:eukaryotic-like serine/threonine-protein kinase